MPSRTERIEMSTSEFDEAIERAALRGAERVLKDLRQLMIYQLAACGVVDRQMIAAVYGVSVDTVERWEERHGWDRCDGPNRRRVYYHWPAVVDSVISETTSC